MSTSGLLRRLWLPAIVLLVACAGAPISGKAVTIRAIMDDPRSYVGNSVVIEGEVTNTMSLVLARYFTIDDGTGSINVITDHPLPRKGQRMRVLGKVNDFFSFGPQTTLVLIEEKGEAIDADRHRRAGALINDSFRETRK